MESVCRCCTHSAHRRRQASLAVFTLLCLLVSGILLIQCTKESSESRAAQPDGASGIVASAHPLASKAAVEILKSGGNAVDAAVAAAFALSVVEPYASGIGGGGFLLVCLAQQKRVEALDFRESAPRGVEPRKLEGDERKIGARSVAVPGSLAGLAHALKEYGTLDLKTVMAPAIRLAEEGFTVNRLLAGIVANQSEKLARFPESRAIYMPDGSPLREGDKFYHKDLARTYRMIVEQGPDVFYKGRLAEAIVREIKLGGGWLDTEDLHNYRVLKKGPVTGSYRGYEIVSMPPPGSGVLVIELLNILEGFDMAAMGHNTAESIQVMVEAMRRVFIDKSRFMGDPDFVRVPTSTLASKAYAGRVRAGIERGSVNRKPVMPRIASGSDQTTHISVADKDGNVVSLTQTLNSFFGSGMTVPGTGILLNNEMSDFDAEPGRPNSIQPGKRPVSSISPTIVFDRGKPMLALGMGGATRIISGLAQIIMNIADYRMSLSDAIGAPRVTGYSEVITLESRIPEVVRRKLVSFGYSLDVRKAFDIFLGGAQGVMVAPASGRLEGGADPRRAGSVESY